MPVELMRVIARCLAKPLDNRYLNAGEVYEALKECEHLWTADEARDWWATHRDPADDTGTDLHPLAPSGVTV